MNAMGRRDWEEKELVSQAVALEGRELLQNEELDQRHVLVHQVLLADVFESVLNVHRFLSRMFCGKYKISLFNTSIHQAFDMMRYIYGYHVHINKQSTDSTYKTHVFSSQFESSHHHTTATVASSAELGYRQD